MITKSMVKSLLLSELEGQCFFYQITKKYHVNVSFFVNKIYGNINKSSAKIHGDITFSEKIHGNMLEIGVETSFPHFPDT